MDWKFCWIVSMIFVILFKISQLESKSKENQEDNVPEDIKSKLEYLE